MQNNCWIFLKRISKSDFCQWKRNYGYRMCNLAIFSERNVTVLKLARNNDFSSQVLLFPILKSCIFVKRHSFVTYYFQLPLNSFCNEVEFMTNTYLPYYTRSDHRTFTLCIAGRYYGTVRCTFACTYTSVKIPFQVMRRVQWIISIKIISCDNILFLHYKY